MWLVNTSSGGAGSVGIVAEPHSDREVRLNDEFDGNVDEEERKNGKPSNRHDSSGSEPNQPLYKGLRSGLPVLAVLEDAAVAVASSRLSPHVSVMQPADTGQSHDLHAR